MLWKVLTGVFGALLVAAAAWSYGTGERLDACNKKRDELQTALAKLEGETKLQTEQIAALEAAEREQQQKAARALAEARQVAQVRQGQIKALQARILAAERSDCDAAVQEIREVLR